VHGDEGFAVGIGKPDAAPGAAFEAPEHRRRQTGLCKGRGSQLREEVVPDSEETVDLCTQAVHPQRQIKAFAPWLDRERRGFETFARPRQARNLGAARHHETAQDE
jgi:hypothetical protein